MAPLLQNDAAICNTLAPARYKECAIDAHTCSNNVGKVNVELSFSKSILASQLKSLLETVVSLGNFTGVTGSR